MTTPAPTFKRFGAAKPPAAAPTPPAVAEAIEPEVIKPEPAPVAPPKAAKAAPAAAKTETSRAVSMFKGGAGAANAITAFTQAAEEKPQFDLFPVVQVVRGNNGGGFVAAKHMPADIKPHLPSGSLPFDAVVLAYRVGVLGYKVKGTGADGVPPEWQCVVPSHDADMVNKVAQYTKNYQYTPAVRKAKFDIATSNAGHAKPFLAVLAFLPKSNMVVEIQTPVHFNSMERSGKELAAHFQADGSLIPFPCKIETFTTPEGVDTANPWKIHHLLFKPMNRDELAAAKAAFEAWQVAAQDDGEIVDAYNKWVTCEDRPLTDEVRAHIEAGARL